VHRFSHSTDIHPLVATAVATLASGNASVLKAIGGPALT
jgi:hypothetical protein